MVIPSRCCCCRILNLTLPEGWELEEGETLAFDLLSDTSGNAGTGLVPNSCGPSPANSTIDCCDDWHDSAYRFALQFLPDPAAFDPAGTIEMSAIECPPEGLDLEGATCGHWFHGDGFGPCASADGDILEYEDRWTDFGFVKNPSDGHIWLGVRHRMEFVYIGGGGRCGESQAVGWLDTGLTIITNADFPFVVPLLSTCSPGACWNTTAGLTTVDLSPLILPPPP